MTPQTPIRFSLAGAAALALSGCAYIPDFEDNSHPLTRVTWELSEIQGEGNTTRLTRGEMERHTLNFYEDGNVQLRLDCNNGNATWNAPMPVRGGGSLTIGRIASTRALCPPPSYGEDLALDLPTTTNYDLLDNNRTLRIDARRVSFLFRAR